MTNIKGNKTIKLFARTRLYDFEDAYDSVSFPRDQNNICRVDIQFQFK